MGRLRKYNEKGRKYSHRLLLLEIELHIVESKSTFIDGYKYRFVVLQQFYFYVIRIEHLDETVLLRPQ